MWSNRINFPYNFDWFELLAIIDVFSIINHLPDSRWLYITWVNYFERNVLFIWIEIVLVQAKKRSIPVLSNCYEVVKLIKYFVKIEL